MNTITVKVENDEQEFDMETHQYTGDDFVEVVFENVSMFQVGSGMLQMIFENGNQKVLTRFVEIDVVPDEEQREEMLKKDEPALDS